MYHLPPTASPESQLRHTLAQNLISDCPPAVGREILLLGAVARGVADQFSEVELRFYVDEVQAPEIYETWLTSVGAKVDPILNASEAGINTKSWFGGIFIEATWYALENFDWTLRPLLTARTTEHWQLVEAWQVFHAVSLTTAPTTAMYKTLLSHYPTNLQAALITPILAVWSEPHWYPRSLVNLWTLAQRGAKLALATQLTREVERVLRLLFALNKQWEPDYRWLASELKRLEKAPEGLLERIDDIFTLLDSARSVKVTVQLIIDTLALLPPEFDAKIPLERTKEALNLAVFMK